MKKLIKKKKKKTSLNEINKIKKLTEDKIKSVEKVMTYYTKNNLAFIFILIKYLDSVVLIHLICNDESYINLKHIYKSIVLTDKKSIMTEKISTV